MGRRFVWSDPKVQELAKRFVPAADEVWYLQNMTQSPESRLFVKVAEQGHYGGRTKPTNTRQGIYATAPSGTLLASMNNSHDSAQMIAMLEKALAKWETLSKEERLLAKDPKPSPRGRTRLEDNYPEGGLVLRVNTRDLPRDQKAQDWRGNAWNQDFAWFRKGEARSFLPDDPVEGATQDVPVELVRRLAKCHLIDNVRGQIPSYREEAVKAAELAATVVKVEGDVVSLHLAGRTRVSAEGKWPVHGLAVKPLEEQSRGYDATLLGRARYDLKAERFVAFELVAVGMRWGAAQYNGRGDDLDPAPMGAVLTLAGDTPADHVAPANLWEYGWK